MLSRKILVCRFFFLACIGRVCILTFPYISFYFCAQLFLQTVLTALTKYTIFHNLFIALRTKWICDKINRTKSIAKKSSIVIVQSWVDDNKMLHVICIRRGDNVRIQSQLRVKTINVHWMCVCVCGCTNERSAIQTKGIENEWKQIYVLWWKMQHFS